MLRDTGCEVHKEDGSKGVWVFEHAVEERQAKALACR